MGWDLEGKMAGLVGLGHINSRLARMCQGFDMRVQAYDPYVPDPAMKEQGVSKIADLDELMASSDVVAVCLPLNAETRGIVSESRLKKMNSSAFLINVGRGACVDEAALLSLLKAGAIAGCGLDVFAEEPLRKDGHPFERTDRDGQRGDHAASGGLDTRDVGPPSGRGDATCDGYSGGPGQRHPFL